ncbi:DUF4157 domain-containing protein [Nostoc sp. MS1]|uniref:eCIS core domain-containing protein n=1 Tax=Nostoc sp. MS1 TaxID=2764711 RepID=UPI001CC35541|nr:DUF4157 domain-containing protein [Nostoc sp. MS1]BCL35119.1 hypothetical protein NSMS1_15660 [Nostoc sp. MS1]
MRERIAQRKKTTSSVSIPTLKQPTRGFGLESLNASPSAVTEVQPMNKPLGHDISRIALHRPQAKLTIGEPGDFYEQQADSVARQVIQRIAQSGNRQSIQRQEAPEEEELQMKPLDINTLQRQQAPEEEEELQMKSLDSSILQRQEVPQEEELQMKPMVQRQGGGEMAATSDLETSINQARGGGQPLGNDIREPMEQAFGADFSKVKVHTDTQSDQLNKSIQARAFTTGQDVFFRQGEYNPGSRGGQELLAHELTHVVQQNGGAVQRSPSSLTPYPQQPGMLVNRLTSTSVGKLANDYTINQKTTAESGNKIAMKPSLPLIKANNQGSRGGEIVINCAERRVTTFDKREKNWVASMEIIDSDDPHNYVHLSRSTVDNEKVINESVAKAQGLKPVPGKNAKSIKTETLESGDAPFDRTNYTENNNVHITLEGRYKKVLSKVAKEGFGIEDVKGGSPVTEYDNLNYARGTALDERTIQTRITEEAGKAKTNADANIKESWKEIVTDVKKQYKGDKDKINKEIDRLKPEHQGMHNDRQNSITAIEQGTLNLTNNLIASVPALTDMQAKGTLVQYHGNWT